MIEGYNNDGLRVLINPLMVVEVYAGSTMGYGSFWCNVKTTSGEVIRFTGTSAETVYRALLARPVQD